MKDKKPKSKRKTILLTVNIVMFFFILVLSILLLFATRGNYEVFIMAIVYEVVFILLSLIVYYLSIIADSVSRIAAAHEKEE